MDLSWHLLFFLLHSAWSRDWDIPPNSLHLLLGMIPPGCWTLGDAASHRRGLALALEGCRSISWAEQTRAEGPPLPSSHRNSWKPPKIDLLVENSPSPLTSFLPAQHQAGPPACDPLHPGTAGSLSPAQTSLSQPCLGKMKGVQREGKHQLGVSGRNRPLGIPGQAGCWRRQGCRDVWGDGAEGVCGGISSFSTSLCCPGGPVSSLCFGPFGKGHSKRSCCPWDVPNQPLAGDAECVWMQPKPILECPWGSSPCDLTPNALKHARKGKSAGI